MRFLGIGDTNDLASMYLGLVRQGHEVRVFVGDANAHDVMKGMLERVADWQAELGWVRDAGEDGYILFESADRGDTQDELRRQGFQVIGGSAFGDRLECDREFGQSAFQSIGLPIASTSTFHSWDEGIAHVEAFPARYVLKFNGASFLRTDNYVGQLTDGRDCLAALRLGKQRGGGAPVEFVLMQHLEGIEVGVGGYFNGDRFLRAACIDFEHKHFFPGDLGELTGEMGTVVSYEGSRVLFERVLEPLTPMLREGGYCGYINVNLIANEHGLWPLEFTSRFGYPGYAICEALHLEDWARIFQRLVRREQRNLSTRPGFAVGVVLTVPPFPYSYGYERLSKGNPIFVLGPMQEDSRSLSLAEVEMAGEVLIASGTSGYLGVATGTGLTIDRARDEALTLARRFCTPNLRYRDDIGTRVSREDWRTLERWGLIGHWDPASRCDDD